MRRIGFIRSIEVQQAYPYLHQMSSFARERDLEFKLFFTDGDCGPEDFPGEAEKMAGGVTPAEVVERITAWGADGVISLSIPDENSLRDAIVRDLLAERGIQVVTHNLSATAVLANKWDTKQAVLAAGLSTPEGLLVDGDLANHRNIQAPAYADYLRTKARNIGYPLLSKPLWDCLATGIQFLPGPDALDAYLKTPYNGNTVLEKCLAGELCSVEIIGTRGNYVAQPLIWKGRTGGAPSFVFDEIRYAAPRPRADEQFAPVLERLLGLCAEFDLHGSIEVEMIYCEGTYQIIEINPRVSGSTTLSIAASGDNTYTGLVRLLLGEWQEAAQGFGSRRRLAFQLPTCPIGPELRTELAARVDLIRASTFHIAGQDYANMVLSCPLDSARKLAVELRVLTDRFGLLPPAVLTRVEGLLADADSRLKTAPAPA